MAFEHPFLMHAILAFSANHFSRTHRADFESDPAAIEQVVDFHRGDALKLLGEAGRNVTPKSYDALVAAAILVILDSIANASFRTNHHLQYLAGCLISVEPPPFLWPLVLQLKTLAFSQTQTLISATSFLAWFPLGLQI